MCILQVHFAFCGYCPLTNKVDSCEIFLFDSSRISPPSSPHLIFSLQELNAEEFQLWSDQRRDAEMNLHQRETLLQQLTNQTESRLELLGEGNIRQQL